MIKEYTCIICPNGCDIEVCFDEKDNNKILSVDGAICKKGEEYINQELHSPMRSIQTSILVIDGELPVVSVSTNNPIPKKLIFEVMEATKAVTVTAPIKIGDIVIKNICNTNVDIIATKDIKKV